MRRKIGAAALVCLLLTAAAGGAHYAYRSLDKAPSVVSSSEEGKVVTRRNAVMMPGSGGEVVVEEEVSAETEDKAIGDEEAREVELPFAVEYFAEQLTEDEQTVCRQLYKGMTEHEEEIYIKKKVIDQEDICQLIVMCVTGSPEIDYIDPNYSVQVDGDGYASAVFMTYTRSAEDSQMRSLLMQQAIDRICAEVTPSWTDFQKYKLVHDAIVNSCVYFESDTDSDCYTAYGCLMGGNAVCEGYSKALMLLCDRVDIPCLPVIGQGLSEDGSSQVHIWNKVMINGRWYASDITWDDPVFVNAENYLRYDYFSVTDEEMGRNHIQDDNKYMNEPECVDTEYDYYRYYGYFAESADDAETAFSHALRDAMANGDEFARIKCADKEVFDQTLEWVYGNGAGDEKLFDMMKQGAKDNPDMGYDTGGYSVINNGATYNISVRLRFSEEE